MRCPFLKETRVKYCDKSAFRKMIRIPAALAQETCSSSRYGQCSVYQRHAEEGEAGKQCPYLRESMAQYCSTASVKRFIPYRESLLSRCGSDAYRYCDVFLAAANPPTLRDKERQEDTIHGIPMPNWLHYSPNHMWLDVAKDGSCHLGLDAFLARVLASVERIVFLSEPGIHRPSAMLTVRGVDLEVVFPNPMLLTASNLYLRANPAKLTADPYGTGWLFQGIELPGQAAVTSGLIRGEAIMPWIEREVGRMSAFFSQCRISPRGEHRMNDGGIFSEDVLQHLTREETLRLFHEFFWGLRVGSC